MDKVKKLYIFVLVCVSVFLFSACGRNDTLGTVSKNLTEYDLCFDIDCEEKSIQASQRVNYLNQTGTTLNEVRFHIYVRAFEQGVKNVPVSTSQSAKAYPNGVSYAQFTLQSLAVSGNAVEPEYAGDDGEILVVKLDKPIEDGQRVKISMEYNIKIPNINHRFGYGNNTINLGNIYPIACVYGQKGWSQDPYNANGDPFYSDIANYKVQIVYDNAYTLACTGDLRTSKDANSIVSIAQAVAVRDFAMVLSDRFQQINKKVGKTEVKYVYFDDPNAQSNLDIACDALACFSKKFYDYPYSSLSIVKADFMHGGMEYPELVYISADLDNNAVYQNCIVHEIAHQWWYGLVGNDEYNEAWLDEPLAEFSTALFYKWNPKYNVRYRDIISSTQDNMSLFLSVYREVLGNVDTSMTRALNQYDTDAEYTYMQYVKGVLFYDNLMSSIGERRLVRALKDYADEYAFKNATRQSLIGVFEKSTNVSLKNFFASWIEGKIIIN